MNSEKTPRQNRVREALGRIYDQQPPLFREYLQRYKEDPTSRVFAPLAEAYRRLGRVDEAIEICREGLEHHPDFHGGRVALAKCYLEKKLFAEARAELEKVVKIVPENLLAQRLLGDIYLALKHPREALHCYKMALLLSPSDVALAERVHALETAEAAADARAVAQPVAPSAPVASPGVAPRPAVVRPEASRQRPMAPPAPTPAPDTLAPLDLELPPLWQEVEEGPQASPRAPMAPTAMETAPIEMNEPSIAPEAVAAMATPKPSAPKMAAPVMATMASDSAMEPLTPAHTMPMGDDLWNDAEAASPAEAAVAMPTVPEDEEPAIAEMSPEDKARVDSLLGLEANVPEDEAFKIEHVSSIFGEPPQTAKKEITTETLGDLYFSQGQFDTALRIFERLGGPKPPPDLERKISACRMKLGVGKDVLIRNRQIEVLQGLLSKVRTTRGRSA